MDLNYKEEFKMGDGVILDTREMITSDFPKSEDQNVDVVVIAAEAAQRGATARKQKLFPSESSGNDFFFFFFFFFFCI